MAFERWQEQTRARLSEVLPEAVVVLPIGATEQHGPHLATGTDALLATEVVDRAVPLAAPDASRNLLIAPPVPFGVSEHHLPYGGTLSLGPETMTALLLDIARSIGAQGGSRLVFVNGHGGNMGVCQAAGAAASTRYGVSVGYVDYWSLAGEMPTVFPGHAGEFETSLMLAVRPELVRPAAPRAVPETLALANGQIHSDKVWSGMDGFTDQPSDAKAANGEEWLATIVRTLADRLIELARVL